MLNCLFNGKRICSLDTKNKYGNYIYDIIELLREAGQSKQLVCEECSGLVYLRAGNKKIPHFAHITLSPNCPYEGSTKESEEHLKGKSILYYYFKALYPDANIQVNFRHPNKRRTDLYIEFPSGQKLAIEYQRKELKVSDWKEKHNDYTKMYISDIWILSFKEYKNKKKGLPQTQRIKFFEELILHRSKDETLKFLDTDTNRIIFVKKLEYKDKDGLVREQDLWGKGYDLSQIIIQPDGIIQSPFEKQFPFYYERFMDKAQKREKEEEEYQKRIEERRNFHRQITKRRAEIRAEKIKNQPELQQQYQEKLQERLKEEALACKENNPNGPWYDSRANRWAVCNCCGEFTKSWTSLDGKTNTCICNECYPKR